MSTSIEAIEDRQTGRTTRQIVEAPDCAIYICGNQSDRRYTESLGRHLGRTDLRFETPQFFESDRWHGMVRPIVVDHNAPRWFTPRQEFMYREVKAYLQMRGIHCD